MKTQFQVHSNILENHSQLQTMSNKHDELSNNLEIQQDQLNSKLKMEEELNYYKVKKNFFL